jgi:hypothetical protein
MFGVVSGFLITVAVYAGFRMVYYGQLANALMRSRPTDQELSRLWTLADYYDYVARMADNAVSNSTSWLKLLLEFAALFRYPVGMWECQAFLITFWVLSTIAVFCFSGPASIRTWIAGLRTQLSRLVEQGKHKTT